MAALGETGFTTIWNNDYHCLHTKTKALQNVYESQVIPIKGVFRTVSEGNNPSEPNCYMFPLEGGAWRVYRFANAAECDTWTKDGQGRTTCYFNKRATLKTAALFYGGVEDAETNEYVVTYDAAMETARCLGEELTLPSEAKDREIRLGKSKDGRLVVKIKKETKESSISGWVNKGKSFYKVLKASIEEREDSYNEYDDVFRKLVSTSGGDAGWVLKNQDVWVECAKDDIKNRLEALGVAKADINPLLGNALYKPWKLVNLPFQDEYPGGRQWNLNAAQLAFEPIDSEQGHPTWDLVLKHCGKDLNDAVAGLDWCREENIFSGADYLKSWLACLFRCPFEPLPYLFFFGDQDVGKSIFHEATSLLMTKGYVLADKALTNANDFNGELDGAILCVVEEKDISAAKGAYAKIKDWVTAPFLAIRKMRTDVYLQPNTTHWVQCANHRKECPIFTGDTRIVAMFVRKPDNIVPKTELRERLKAEAPQFLYTLMNMELPKHRDRLRLPIVVTQNKIDAAQANRDELQEFVDDALEKAEGERVSLPDFNERFKQSLDDASSWP